MAKIKRLLLIASLLIVTVAPAAPALAATAGQTCSPPGATQGNLICGGSDNSACSDQGCVWAVATTPTTNAKTFCQSSNLTPAQRDGCRYCGNAGANPQTCLQNNPIVKDLQAIVNFLSAAVAVVVIGVIVLGGIQYIMAGDSADKVSAAKKRILNGIIAFAAFLFLFAFVQWLIPGGVFG